MRIGAFQHPGARAIAYEVARPADDARECAGTSIAAAKGKTVSGVGAQIDRAGKSQDATAIIEDASRCCDDPLAIAATPGADIAQRAVVRECDAPIARAERTGGSCIRECRSADRDRVDAGCAGIGVGAAQRDRPAGITAEVVNGPAERARQINIGIFRGKNTSTIGIDITGD